MKKEKWKMIGKVGKHTDFFVLTNDESDEGKKYYLAKNVKEFQKAGIVVQERQRIKRIISNTIFLRMGAVRVYDSDTVEKLREIFKESEQDAKLRSIVELCEGADFSDVEKLADVEKVLVWEELEITKGGLRSGLGFPGFSASIIIAKTKPMFEFEDTLKFFVQKVKSYPEGYCVEHIELERGDLVVIPKAIDKIKEHLQTVSQEREL